MTSGTSAGPRNSSRYFSKQSTIATHSRDIQGLQSIIAVSGTDFRGVVKSAVFLGFLV